jgi:benzoyl-CoA reductase subunit B
MEIPFITDRSDAGHVESARRYFRDQAQDAIEQMEKATGIRYDDERLIEAVHNQWEACRYWGLVCLLQKAVPAPLDMRMLESFGAMLFSVGPFRRDGVEAMKVLYQETQERVEQGIAALGIERCRLLYDGQPVYYRVSLLRYPSRYGAVVIGGRFTFIMHGSYSIAEDGTWGPAPTLEELGVTMRTREDALRVLADHCMLYRPMMWTEYVPAKVREHIMLAQQWNVDGVLYHLDLGCKFIAAGHQEAKLAVQNLGIPTMVFEASSSDPRDLSEGQVLDQMDAFLQNLGLTPIQDSRGTVSGDDE